ncbi:uncharacterized protein LOC129909275 [Episyrphus balteatus]|uniref:uncharacterized protein LOC129909275 n=1 Tax=Episyrphus balteatus TaxID=286459 RepID=UPI0024866CB3|nr:uncharacterized protein LOC129909275 [Episyrphus balteatus]
MRTCPTTAKEVILDFTPLHPIIESAAKGAIMRFAKEGTGAGKCIGNREREFLSRSSEENFLNFPRDAMVTNYNFVKNYNIHLSSKKDWTGREQQKVQGQASLGQSPSIFQAEVNAIVKCAEINLELKHRNKNIAIMSDSQAALKALKSYEINSKLVLECIGKLNELGKINKVTLHWVPGHVGVQGNEEADSLAKTGANSPLMGPESYCGIGENVIKNKIKLDEESRRA